MLTLRDKIKLLLDTLSLELQRGVRCLEIVKAVNQLYKDGQLKREVAFFEIVYDACRREALLSLAKLVIAEKESLSVEYLLNCALEVPSKGFAHASREELKAAVSEHRHRLAELAPLVEDLKARRDRSLAHLDRKHVNEPQILANAAIDLEKVDQAFEMSREIINVYRGYFGMPALTFEAMRAGLNEEMVNLAFSFRPKR